MNNAYEKKIIFQAKMCFWRAFPAEKIACLPEPEIARTLQAFSLEPPGPTGFFISGIWTTLAETQSEAKKSIREYVLTLPI